LKLKSGKSMQFYKYHGAGNDFIMLDQRTEQWLTRADQAQVAHLCHRRFGIGADGLILLQTHPEAGYEMVYFNSDGSESTLCGNGGRCFVAFAHALGLVNGTHFRFMAIDGVHEAVIQPAAEVGQPDWVELHMHDVEMIQSVDNQSFVLNTGSPHFVQFTQDVGTLDVDREGCAIRQSPPYAKEGINVNFVEPIANQGIRIRTYERGVEAETLACGTGVTAAALAWALQQNQPAGTYEQAVEAEGGHLAVRYTRQPDGPFTDIWLCGPAQRVFEGEVR
jgi:diaminopimelate epimerase